MMNLKPHEIRNYRNGLYRLNLMESMPIPGGKVQRVPGGWNFCYDVLPVPVFVPYTEEPLVNKTGPRKSTALIQKITDLFPADDRRPIRRQLENLRSIVGREVKSAMKKSNLGEL